MSRFVYVNDMYYNVDSIEGCYRDNNGRLHVELTNGEEETVSPECAGYIMKQLSGMDHIIQVIPVTEPMYAVWKDEQQLGGYFAVPIYYLALCADGVIRSAECCDGWFECVSIEHSTQCMGLYHKDQLDRFPGALDSLTKKEAAHETAID